MTLENGQKVIAFDFDGVLHDYHGWNDGKLAGPIPGMLDLVTQLIAAGAAVVVHTTRSAETVLPWLKEHGFPPCPVMSTKWSRIDVFVDDRAYHTFDPVVMQVATNPAALAKSLLDFQPYWRRP